MHQVLKQVHPDTGISQNAMMIMNDYVYDIFERVVDEARLRNLCLVLTSI